MNSIKFSVLLLAAYSVNVPLFAADECADEATAKANVERLDQDIVQLRNSRKVKEAETEKQIDEVAKTLVQQGKWTESDRSKFFASQLKSDQFILAEKRKKTQLGLFFLATQTMIVHKDKNELKEACISANDMREIIAKIGSINDAQYKNMLTEIESATEAK